MSGPARWLEAFAGALTGNDTEAWFAFETAVGRGIEHAGDSWRKRYKSLCLHDPVWYDHLPYLPFPDHWPVFTPKDMLGDWLEMYVKVMGLNYWGSTRCVVVGASTSAHDICASLWENGAEVTMLQRSPTVVATSGSLEEYAWSRLYSEAALAAGITTEARGPLRGLGADEAALARSGGPRLWFHGGNLMQSRHYSLYLALQLKARMEGIATPVYGMDPVHHLD